MEKEYSQSREPGADHGMVETMEYSRGGGEAGELRDNMIGGSQGVDEDAGNYNARNSNKGAKGEDSALFNA